MSVPITPLEILYLYRESAAQYQIMMERRAYSRNESSRKALAEYAAQHADRAVDMCQKMRALYQDVDIPSALAWQNEQDFWQHAFRGV